MIIFFAHLLSELYRQGNSVLGINCMDIFADEHIFYFSLIF